MFIYVLCTYQDSTPLYAFSLLMNASFSSVSFNTEDGGVTLNGAKVIKTLEFADATKTGVVHEVDGFISPSILWRYADQCEYFAYV